MVFTWIYVYLVDVARIFTHTLLCTGSVSAAILGKLPITCIEVSQWLLAPRTYIIVSVRGLDLKRLPCVNSISSVVLLRSSDGTTSEMCQFTVSFDCACNETKACTYYICQVLFIVIISNNRSLWKQRLQPESFASNKYCQVIWRDLSSTAILRKYVPW